MVRRRRQNAAEGALNGNGNSTMPRGFAKVVALIANMINRIRFIDDFFLRPLLTADTTKISDIPGRSVFSLYIH